MKIDKNVIIILALLLYLPLVSSCHKLNIFTLSDPKVSNKYFIGRANTENFQKMIEEILLEFDYYIEEFDNGPTSSYIITRWKIREASDDSSSTGFKESKTRLIINGMIDNQSFEKNNGFSYDCFLEVRNFVYNGKDFVPFYEDAELNDEVIRLVERFATSLSIEK